MTKLFVAILLSAITVQASALQNSSENVVKTKKYLRCGSNTNTDGDNIVSVPVTLVTTTSAKYTDEVIAIPDGTLKAEIALGITDMSFASVETVTVKNIESNGQIQIKFPKHKYTLGVDPSVSMENGERHVVAADVVDGVVGPASCSLSDKSYNQEANEYP